MSVSNKHILEQGASLAALSRVALSALKQRSRAAGKRHLPSLPGPSTQVTVSPPSLALVADYVRHVGGDPGAYRGVLPPHLFPQWGLAPAGETLLGLPYPMAKVMNFGCDFQVHRPLPADEPLQVSARLESIDDDGRRAVLQQRVVTGTRSAPDALVADLFVFIPLGGKSDRPVGAAAGAKKLPARVPIDARELAYFHIGSRAGLDFAKLTGDFNPVHWLPPYARAFGFPNVILHGFGTMARAIEGVHRGVFSGDVRRMKKWSCRFTRPLVLPARVGLYVRGHDVFVGNAPGGPAYLVGSFETHD